MNNKTHIKNTSKGFTLIELIITVVAIGIFGSITANILANASKIYSDTLKKQKFVSEARSSFFQLNRNLNLQTWPSNDNVGNSKIINIQSANNTQLQYSFLSTSELRFNILQHPNLDPTSQTLSTITDFNSSNIYYYDDQNNFITDDLYSNNITLTKINVLFNNSRSGYLMNFESYISPQNYQFGKPMDYHE
jgi:prepilin-type N-terminal cleavage/methylation domain-containing protein|tara:strand:+ start:452 stop:1027 length:576 start_codon:yes stop_codon:yes gene_type:complete